MGDKLGEDLNEVNKIKCCEAINSYISFLGI